MLVIRGILSLLRWTRRLATFLVFLGMLSLLVTALTVASVNAFVTGALTAVTGAQTVAGKLRADKAKLVRASRGHFRQAAVQRRASKAHLAAAALTANTLRKSRTRISRRMTRAVASAPTKAIPAAGAAVVLTMTVAELAASCDEVIEIDRAVDGDTPGEIDATEAAFRGFCEQNMSRLTKISQKAEPILGPFDDAGVHVWSKATQIIERAEDAAEGAEAIRQRSDSLISRVCGILPVWVCGEPLAR